MKFGTAVDLSVETKYNIKKDLNKMVTDMDFVKGGVCAAKGFKAARGALRHPEK